MKGMKKALISLMIFSLVSPAFGDCDWSTIKKNSDGTYTYSAALNLCVGQLVQTNKTQAQQIADYTKSLTLKDLAIKASDEKAQLWSNTSAQLEDRLQKVDSLEKKSDWLWFGLGVLATSAAAFTAAKLSGH